MPDKKKIQEELVKLLCGVSCESDLEGHIGSCPDRKHGKCRQVERLELCVVQHIAAHLIENGVTIEQWIPVDEEPPTKFTQVLLWDEIDEDVFVGEYLGDGKWRIPGFDGYQFCITHWNPRPKSPKEG